ncbi:MAG: hypothetical protein RTV31_14090 [Candidatus Thorarchaeota archaeon]
MNEKSRVLAVLGLFIALSSYVLNALFMMLFLESTYIPEGPIPHSGPLIIGTFWLFLIPVGFILVFLSIFLEIKDRFQRKESNEIWE